MSLEHAILGFLYAAPRSGYDLKTRCFDVEARTLWTADQAQIYRTLERLKDSRLVSVTRRRQAGRPDRKLYEITPAGRDTFAALETAAAPLPAPRDAFLLQVYFAAEASDDVIVSLLHARRAQHQSRLEQLRADAIALADDSALTERASAMRHAAFDGAMARERASIDWLDDIREAISAGHLPPAEISESGSANPLFGWAQA
ncbi:MAG: PadR family transcriptional regulator [Coriobacteriia bacterium]|nr:PadR family transcriptional regulator [Coriobacteriia bacterium]